MMHMLQNLSDQVVTRWGLALIVSLVMFILMSFGLLMRHSFVATVEIDIGGVLTNSSKIFRFIPFEDVNTTEAFFSHHVFAKNSEGRLATCKAKGMSAPEGQKLRIECKDRSDTEVRKLIASALDPLIVRHSRFFEVSSRYEEQRQKHIERHLRSLEQRLKILQEQPVSSLAKVLIVQYQFDIETLEEQIAIDRLLGERVRETRVNSDGVEVLNRAPNWTIWLVALVLAIGSGIFMAVFMARLDGSRNE